MVPFDVQGLTPDDWWVSDLTDLGPGPRNYRYWWQAKSAFNSPQTPGTYIDFYAATVDDNDLTDIDGLGVGSGIGNYLVDGTTNYIAASCASKGIPKHVTANVTTPGCSCLSGSFQLAYDSVQQVWTSTPIYCTGASGPTFAQFNCRGFGFAASGTTIGNGQSALSSGTVGSVYPFAASGSGWNVGNTTPWCFSSTVTWTVEGRAVPVPTNLHFIGALASDGTGGSGVPNVTSGYVEIDSRYLYLLAHNTTNKTLSPLGADHQFTLLPVPDEVQ